MSGNNKPRLHLPPGVQQRATVDDVFAMAARLLERIEAEGCPPAQPYGLVRVLHERAGRVIEALDRRGVKAWMEALAAHLRRDGHEIPADYVDRVLQGEVEAQVANAAVARGHVEQQQEAEQ